MLDMHGARSTMRSDPSWRSVDDGRWCVFCNMEHLEYRGLDDDQVIESGRKTSA